MTSFSHSCISLIHSYPLLYDPLKIDSADIIFDLRYSFMLERSLLSEEFGKLIPEQLGAAGEYLSKRGQNMHMVAVLPGIEAACAADCFRTSANITLLFTEPLIPEKLDGENKPLQGWVDSHSSVAAGLFKVPALSNNRGGIYYLRSNQAMRLFENQADESSSYKEEPFEFLQQAKRLGFLAEETEYFQVYKIKLKDKA